jgi:hypothetical protein
MARPILPRTPFYGRPYENPQDQWNFTAALESQNKKYEHNKGFCVVVVGFVGLLLFVECYPNPLVQTSHLLRCVLPEIHARRDHQTKPLACAQTDKQNRHREPQTLHKHRQTP